ncbi:hypothetical protein J9317_02430 [Metabacillus sp. KIGAM252]|uniref:Uncharacterized protein n=1 Tax=Metabacillus flavus TaxID=2823519 RepID=A0ABS5LAL9_9BACI|nr:hypothetical protein [Metabacillus flavus]MBS2967628.1 hypothetical protein [Metabacillus flavus]
MNFLDWKLEMGETLNPITDGENKKMVILDRDEDTIHAVLELGEENNLIIHPQWRITIEVAGDKHLRFSTPLAQYKRYIER